MVRGLLLHDLLHTAAKSCTESMLVDFCLLICVRPGGVVQASVVTVDCTRGWSKICPSNAGVRERPL